MINEKPKLKLYDGSTKFKRNKVGKIDSELKVTGHRKTDIDGRMLQEMKEFNKHKLIGANPANSTISVNGAGIGKKKNSTMLTNSRALHNSTHMNKDN